MAVENTPSHLTAPPEGGELYQALFELPSGELRLEPVLQVGKETAAVRYGGPPNALRAGLEIASVRLFQGGTQVLACSASISSVSPSAGGKTLDVGLTLRPAVADASATVQQADVINTMVNNLVDGRATALLCVGGVVQPCAAQLARIEGQPAYVVLEVRGTTDGLVPKAPCELTCQLYGVRVVLRAVIQELRSGRLGAHTLHVRWPHAMVASRRRTANRVQKLALGAYVAARLPFSKKQTRHSIADLSRQGFAFEADASSWIAPGMVIPHLEINLPNTKLRARGCVRNVRQTPAGKLYIGVAFLDLSSVAERTLDDFVTHHTHPTARSATARDIPALWPLLREAGYLPEDQASRVMRQFESTRSLLLTRAPQLLLQTVQGDAADILSATAEVARIGEKAWRLQHVVSRTANVPVAAVMDPLLQTFMKRHDTGFLQMWWPLKSPVLNAEALYKVVPQPHMHVRVWGQVGAARTPLPAHAEEEMRTAGSNDRQWVARRLQRLLTPLECEALDCADRHLQQGELSRLYRNVGLDFQRLVRLVSSVSEALGFALIESSPMGLSLTGMLPCARIFSADKAHRAGALTTLVQDATNVLRAQGHTPTCMAMVDDAAVLENNGHKVAGWYAEIILEHSVVLDLPAVWSALASA